ncbi:MAG: C69 family dipeptidase [Desulfovibrio sp.]|jgi:dipeptidase|nr:C69 family dipeptidase [Desulfovibrio sp.]
MMSIKRTAFFSVAAVCIGLLSQVYAAQGAELSACTTMIVTPGAAADGSAMVSHSDDNDLMDQSIVYVPARDWPQGALRPVYPSAAALTDMPEWDAYLLPRLNAPERAPGYDHPEVARTKPLGFIDQVAHTYAYLDGNYGIVNEHGLMFGECTDGTYFTTGPDPKTRLFYSSELSRVALERCKTARCAVETIGSLIETYGYYGTGETLPVADGTEAWVIETAPLPKTATGPGGLWIAQKVPDGEFFVAANEFRIRDIYPDGKGKYEQLYGNTLKTIEKLGIAKKGPDGRYVDWLLTVSRGEYNHPYYSLRRVWRALSLVAPSLGLNAWVKDGTTRDYPFSVKPDKPLTLADIRRIHSDHYEGTEFDLTKGVAAGPFGNPNRYLGPNDPSGDVGEHKDLKGAWERPICMFYTGYTFISQTFAELPYPLRTICWTALDTPGESVFVPLAVAPLPASYARGDTRRYDKDSAWWTYNLVAEYANLKYNYIIKDIRARAATHEKRGEELVRALRQRLEVTAGGDGKDVPPKPGTAAVIFGGELRRNAEAVRGDWQEFFFELTAKYNQGFVNSPERMAETVGYPQEWLDRTNYADGPTGYERPEKRR